MSTDNKMIKSQIAAYAKQRAIKKSNNEWYNLRPILGNANWAMSYIILGGRMTGKSYAVIDYFCSRFVKNGNPFIWLRLTETAARKLLQNNAEKLVDPDLRRRYKLDLTTSGNNVYHITKRSAPDKNGKTKVLEKVLFARVYAVNTFYNDKGSIYDKDFLTDHPDWQYLIGVDEFQREENEKNTFDVVYSLVNQLENLIRTTKDKVKIFFLGNTLEEASDVLSAFGFIPESFGTFKLKKKRCVIQNIAPTEEYKSRRSGSFADLLMPHSSTFTNERNVDNALITKKKLRAPSYIIKFNKDPNYWYTVWDDNVVCKYNKEKKGVVAMRPYLDEVFQVERQKRIIELFDTRCFVFRDLITFRQFQQSIALLKPRK